MPKLIEREREGRRLLRMTARIQQAQRQLVAMPRFAQAVDEGLVLALAFAQASHELQQADDERLLVDLDVAIGALETAVDAQLRSWGVKS
jgi:hypothetical protein